MRVSFNHVVVLAQFFPDGSFFAVIDDSVDHVVIILHGYFSVLQMVFRKKVWNLLKTEWFHEIASSFFVHSQGNNITDTDASTCIAFSIRSIELRKDVFQKRFRIVNLFKGNASGVDSIVVFKMNRIIQRTCLATFNPAAAITVADNEMRSLQELILNNGFVYLISRDHMKTVRFQMLFHFTFIQKHHVIKLDHFIMYPGAKTSRLFI